MKPDQEKVRDLLMDTVGLLCKNGLIFKKQLKIEGLLGITVDSSDVFIVHIDEVFPGSAVPKINSASGANDDHATPVRMVPAPVAEYNQVLTPSRTHTVPLRSVAKSGRKRMSSGKTLPVKRERAEWRENEVGTEAVATSAWNEELDIGLSGSMEHCGGPSGDVGGASYLKSEAGCQSGKACDDDDDELLWMNAINDSNNSHMDFVSNSAQHFDGTIVLDSFDDVTPNDETSFVANASELSDGLNGSAPQKKRGGAETKADGSASRSQRRSSGRRRSARGEAALPFTDTGSSILVADNDETNWDAEVKGQYCTATEIDWDNENGNEDDPTDDQQQWSNLEGNDRGAGRRSAQSSEEREKSFVCQYDQCDKAFFRKDHLIRHQRIKHGKPYGVDTQVVYYCHFADCGRMFYKNASLHRHMNDAHGYVRQE